jgi:hypothetical protein
MFQFITVAILSVFLELCAEAVKRRAVHACDEAFHDQTGAELHRGKAGDNIRTKRSGCVHVILG